MYPPQKQNKNSQQISNLQAKKKSLIIKLTELLKAKFQKVLKEHNYTSKQLQEDLNNYITDDMLKSFDYNKFIVEVERDIILKIGNLSKSSLNLHQNINKTMEDIQDGSKLYDTLGEANIYNNKTLDQNCNIHSKSVKNLTSAAEAEFFDNILPIAERANPSLSPFSKNKKLDILKNIKEKDEWGHLARKNYEEYLEELKNKKILVKNIKNQVKESLTKQVEERNSSKDKNKYIDKDFLESINRDHDEWIKKEEAKKLDSLQKCKQLEQSRVNFSVKKKQKTFEEISKIKNVEKGILDRVQEMNLKEKEKFEKKREAEKKLYFEQLDDVQQRRNNKILKIERERENGLKILQEFDKIMEKKDFERINYSTSIKKKADLQDLRQSWVMGVRKTEEEIKRELEIKYFKEKEEIEKR
jgi:hypothetical protein